MQACEFIEDCRLEEALKVKPHLTSLWGQHTLPEDQKKEKLLISLTIPYYWGKNMVTGE